MNVLGILGGSATAELARAWVYLAGGVLLQSTVLLTSGLVLARALKRRGAAVQSMAIRVALVTTVLCPILAVALGGAGLGAGLFSDAPVRAGSPSPALGPLAAPPPSPNGGATEAADALPAETARAVYLGALCTLACAACTVITALLLLQILAGYVCLRRIRCGAASAPDPVQALCAGIADQMRLTAPSVLVHSGANGPCLLGFAHPAIVLPDATPDEEELRYALQHELAHLARHDCLWTLGGRVLRAFLFFQPLLHLCLRQMECVSDEIADDQVVLMGGGTGYAARLTRMAASLRNNRAPLASVAAMSFQSSLGRRVQRILNPTRPMGLHTSRFATVSILIGALVVLTVTATMCASPQTQKPEDPKPEAAQSEQPERTLPPTEAPVFEDDPAAVGKWTSVDFVKDMADFQPGKQSWRGDLYMKSLELMPGGRTSGPMQWSRGVLYHPGDRSTGKYHTREMDGTRYMFMEWMSGDVIFRGMKPMYYVLEYTAPSTAPNAPANVKIDPKQYMADAPPPFVDDPAVVGTWNSVDFVSEMGDFEAGQKKWPGDMHLQVLEFLPGGAMRSTIAGNAFDSGNWSNGVVWNRQMGTISRYAISEIAGSRYMFFEWVSGDVTIRATKPKYYVLEAAR